MKRLSGIATLLTVMALGASGMAIAQVPPVATLHGHVTNPAGGLLKSGDIKLTTDKTADAKDRVYKYTFPLDASGDYKGKDIAPGDYVAVVYSEKKSIDFQSVTLKAGDDKALDFDMTRAEYLKAMTPEERAQLEEFKKKNASVSADNAKIANINKVLLQAREDEKNGKATDAVNSLKPLTDLKPNEPVLWASLGEAELAVADSAYKAARAAKTPTTDPAIMQDYTDAAASYQKAIDLSVPPAKVVPENVANYYLNLGQADSRSGKLQEAGAAYETAAKTAPSIAPSAYYNESVVFYTASKMPEANAAADKAIAADPKRADPYYIKGQALIPGATTDKSGKFVLPPGCLESYQEYLELAPDGAHAAEVKELLAGLGQPVKNSFKAPGKR